MGRAGRLPADRREREARLESSRGTRRARVRATEHCRVGRLRRGEDPLLRGEGCPRRRLRRRLIAHPRLERFHRRHRDHGRQAVGKGRPLVPRERAARTGDVSFEVHPVTPERWPDMVELFERRGVRGGRGNTPAYGCWCMYWRDRSLAHGEPKKRAMAKLVRGGREPGLLAYEDGV